MGYYDKDPNEDYKQEKKIPDWIGHPNKNTLYSDIERDIQENLQDWEVLYVDSMDEADYEYDDIALMVRKSDGLFVVLRTSGCSCPSPTETWGAQCQGTLSEIKKSLDKSLESWGDYINERQNHERRVRDLVNEMIVEGNI